MAGEGGHDVAQGLHVHLSGALLHVVITLGVVELGQLLVFGDTVGEQGPPGRVHQGVAGLVLLLQTIHYQFISFVQNVIVDFLKTARSYRNIFSKTCILYVEFVYMEPYFFSMLYQHYDTPMIHVYRLLQGVSQSYLSKMMYKHLSEYYIMHSSL